ncbi:MAG: hypothetical protein JSS56_08755 [Proteobacteria bacterium]|nr:hypothetical protein [Pseudomonadota bacterium]
MVFKDWKLRPRGHEELEVDMRTFTRRDAAKSLAALGLPAWARAQGKCSVSGMTIEEVLAAWQDVKKAAEMDRTPFLITIQRQTRASFVGKKDGKDVSGVGVVGTLFVNGQPLGDVLENEALRVKAGSYKGVLRYVSSKHFVQGPLGKMDEAGDVLLEVSGVDGRRDLLIHTGTKPWHSEGCILAGAAKKTVVAGKSTVTMGNDSTLKKLREKFYGAEIPVACPNIVIRISINDVGA